MSTDCSTLRVCQLFDKMDFMVPGLGDGLLGVTDNRNALCPLFHEHGSNGLANQKFYHIQTQKILVN